jgi:Asp-tRNA(Asn)/Glu-tRNA(Gln) amidotransferase A subunit family amidase
VIRRAFLLSVGAALAAIGAPGRGAGRAIAAAAAYDPLEKSIEELQAAMTAGQTTSAQLVKFYFDRIAAYDQAGPRLNAVLYTNPRAVAEARALDDERKKRGPRGPMHGIPVLLKDNFETRDMPTTGGSLALSGAVPKGDAFQVKKLRQAGAIVLGKVNLHELALGLTTVSSLGGQTLDPYDLLRAPGGSSGGSGVAAAANFAAFTMGTDTSGSIRIPSSHNSIVGLRPTAGLSSRAGIIPFGHTQDTGGPMARTVADIALVLDATVGYDPADQVTASSNGKIPPTYRSSFNADALRGARIGVLTEFFGSAPEDQEVGSIVRGAIEDMKRKGAAAVDVVVPNLSAQLAASNLLFQELKFYLGDYLKIAPGAFVTSVEELLASGLHTAQFQAFLENANAQPNDYLHSDDYRNRLAARVSLAQAVLEVMDENRLDAIVYPTVRRIAPIVGSNQIGSNAGLSAQSGFPAITVPAGFTPKGFPVGIELLGRPFAEPMLIGLAYSYEQATRHRRPPASTPSLGESFGHRAAGESSSDTGAGSVRFEVAATSRQSALKSAGAFKLIARLSFNDRTRQLGYDLSISGASRDQVAGVYLHRRANRPNGGVAYILARSIKSSASGRITLLEPEAADLKAGKCYISAISKANPLVGARADIVLPPA